MKALISVFILVIKYIEFSLYVQNVLHMHREGLSSISELLKLRNRQHIDLLQILCPKNLRIGC